MDFDRARRDDEPPISVIACMRFLRLTASEVLDAAQSSQLVGIHYGPTSDPGETFLVPSGFYEAKTGAEKRMLKTFGS